MNREIKFRGKCACEWHYGHFFAYRNDGGGTGAHFIIEQESEDVNVKSIQVIPDTIGQFTGLHDKNGKEIYEGDIIAVNGMQIGYIVGGVRGYCYDVIYTPAKSNGEKAWPLYSVVTIDYPNKCEVIGNIHDNKELLKGGKQ